MDSHLMIVTALGPNDPDDGDTGRQMRGLAIAAKTRIDKCPVGYKVPSQTPGNTPFYVVGVDEEPFCSCPDFEIRNEPCKHVYAVEFTVQREGEPDGMKEDKNEKSTKIRRVFERDWTAYDKAQTNEQELFGRLLRDLCDTIVQPEQKMGRPRYPLSDMVFAVGTRGCRQMKEVMINWRCI